MDSEMLLVMRNGTSGGSSKPELDKERILLE